MSHRSEPAFRQPGGVAGCVAFGVFLICARPVAGAAPFPVYDPARHVSVDGGHAIGIVLSLIGASVGWWWIGHHGRRLTRHRAGEIAGELLFAWG